MSLLSWCTCSVPRWLKLRRLIFELTRAYNRGLVSSLATNTTKNKGSMMAVGIGEDQILPYLKRIKNGVLTVACVNSPTSITVSGDQTAIDELKNILDQKSLLVRKVRVDTAYHSHHMKEVGGAYLRSLDTMSSRDVRDGIAFYSTVTGLKKVSDFDPAYWTENLVSQVKFSQALQTLRDEILKSSKSDDGTHTFVEIGPHSALAGPVRQTLADKLATPFQYHYMSALVRDQGAVETILALAGRLFELGYALDFRGVINDAILKPLRTQMIVDLQPYPWDHDKYWHESRLSKSHRFRQFPYHDLCGLLDPMSSSLEPRWRYHANLNALPWLKDHVVDNFIIYPGAGYICMAVEAMKQLVEMRKMPGSISKYILRNVAFRKFIIIPEHGEGGREPEVEIMLTMTPSKAHDGSRWETFRICSYGKDEQWSENCAGLIAVDMTVSGQTEGEFEGDCNEEDLREADNLSTLEFMQQECVTSIDPRSFYQDMRKSGNDFGPNFALINKAIIHDGSHIGVSELTIPDISTIMPYESSRPHVVHPAVFDASQQLSTMLFKTFLSNSPCVPVTSTEIQISADITSKPGDHLIAAHEMVSLGPKSSVSNSLVFQRSENGSFKTVIRVKNGQTRAIGEVHGDVKDMPYDLEIAHKLAWEVDSDFLTDNSFQARLSSEDVDLDEKMFEANQAAAIYLHSALRGLETGSINVTMPHLEKYVAWMRKFCNSDTFKLLTNGMTPDQEHRILASDDTWEKGVDFQMLSRIGKNLPQILAAKADPLALMLEDGLLYQIYDKGTVLGDYEGMKEFLKILSFKKPHLSYIEIGAGTGGATTAVLEALGAPTGRIMLDQYHYTDISAGFFDAAGAKFAEWTDYIEFKTLDIEKDPVQQGFAKASYDVVVASNVLHATKDMDVTMSNVRTLLRPGGTLLLLEVTHNFVANNAVFGTLPGWWAFEDAREDTPLLSKKEWNALLIKHSFSGIDLTKTLTMVSRAVGTEPTNGAGQAKTPTAKLLKGCTTKTVDMIIEAVETASRTKDLNFLNADWEEFCDDQAVTYVVFDSTSNPLLLSPTQYKFDCLQAITNSGNNILWVTVQEDFGTVASSFNGLAEGLGRVLRRENVGMKFVTFNIQRTTAEIPPDWLANAVLQVAESCFWPTNDTQRTFESEFTYRSGEILIPRVETDPKFVTWVHSSLDGNTNVDRVRYRQLSRPLKLHVESPGLLSSLRFVDDEIPSTPLGRFDIQISPHAYGVNFKDVFIALGQMLPSVSMVGEVSGKVTAVGETMKDLYEIGDRVTGLGAESFANHARINGNLAHKIADSMSFTVGATIPAVYLTAYYCLVDVARLQKGQSILIHAASGGVGQAAIQIAQHTSATIFATVGSAVKRQLLVDHYGIPQSHIFSSRSRSFKDGILRLTKDIGVDVVLNSLSGEILSDSMECVKVLGTFVEIGKADIYKSSSLNMAIFDKSITFAAVDLVVVANANPVKIHETFGKVMELFDHGALYPVQTINKFPIGDVEDAFRMIAARRHTGKVVLVIEDDSMVKATPTKPAPLQLRRDGTYVIAGGLGDLGRRSARFMAEHGAGHVVTLSRRAIDNGSKEQLINEMKKLGAQLHIVKCDIADEKMLRGAAEYCSQLPPVCGILHAGMVLRVYYQAALCFQ
jgi:NADPH:quinone reductase-like Zn-dependent oxidoreductase/SAM-dependent methyltransferase